MGLRLTLNDCKARILWLRDTVVAGHGAQPLALDWGSRKTWAANKLEFFYTWTGKTDMQVSFLIKSRRTGSWRTTILGSDVKDAFATASNRAAAVLPAAECRRPT